MEMGGEVARIRKDRYVIPARCRSADRTHSVYASGSAHVLGEKPGQPDLFISAENTFTAMHGDRVVARLITERDG